MEAVTTEDALEILERVGILTSVMERLMERMEFYVNHRCYGKLETGVITFSSGRGMLGKTSRVDRLLEKLEEQKRRCEGQS